MKKIITFFLISIFLLSFFSIKTNAENEITTLAELNQETQDLASKDTEESLDLVDVGTTPDESGYGLKLAMEKLRLAFTLNDEKKAELSLKLSELRVKEARLMVAKDNLKGLERARFEHEKYLKIAEKNIDSLNEDKGLIRGQVKIKSRLDGQKGQIEELESLIMLKVNNLNSEQKEKLISLVEGFKSENENIEAKFVNKEESLKLKLKEKGITEKEIELEVEDEKSIEDNKQNIKFKAEHQINQAEKMYELAGRLIEKYEQNNNTINQSVFDLRDKSKNALDLAKKNLELNEFFKSIEFARDSKRLSVLTISSLHGKFNAEVLEKRLEQIEEKIGFKIKDIEKNKELLKRFKDENKDLIKEFKDNRKELLDKRRDFKEEKDDSDSDDDTEDSDKDS